MGQVNAEATSSRVTLDHPRAPKVAQVDADELDEGLVHMLGERVERAVGNFKTDWTRDLKPEIGLVIKLVLFRYSFFGSSTASPGARLQNLKLVGRDSVKPSRTRLMVFLLLHPPIFPTYLLARLREYGLSNQWPDLPESDWRRSAWKGIIRMENFARLWELGGWAMLLWDGKYPSLLMRALGLRLVPSSPHLAKLVSYEFMNRQLVWNAFTEFAMFAFPLLPPLPSFFRPSSLFAPLKSLLSQPTSIDYASIASLPNSTEQKSAAAHSGLLAGLPMETCPICHLRSASAPVTLASDISLPPINLEGLGDRDQTVMDKENRIFVPAQTDCWGGCKWCYYCVMGELASLHSSDRSSEAMSKERDDSRRWDCLRCGGTVTRAWRAGTEVIDNINDKPEELSPGV